MADYYDLIRQQEEFEDIRAAQRRLTPEGEMPKEENLLSPNVARAVLKTPDPIPLENEWHKMNDLEKFWNSVSGGVHNMFKSMSMNDIAVRSIQLNEGILGSIQDTLNDIEDENDRKKFDVLKGSDQDKEFKERKAKELEGKIDEFSRLTADDYKYATPEVAINASQATQGKSFIDSIAPFLGEVSKDPWNYMLYLTGSSLGAIAPSLVGSMVSGKVVGGVFKMRHTARAIQTALMGYGSYNVELGSYIMDALQEKGYNLQDAQSILKAMQTEDIAGIRTRAVRRAATVGLFDAFSAWLAPMRFNPSNALRYLKSNTAKATTGLVAPVSRTVRFAKGFENLSLQTTLQGVLGGAGEAFGQVVNGEEINWGEVFAEAIGEFTSAPFEVLGLSWSVNAEYNRDKANIQQVQEFAKNEHDIVTFTAAVANKIGDTQTVEQWAEGVGKEAQLFAFAQDLVDQKIPDKIRESNPELAEKIEKAAQEKKDITISMGDVLKTAVKDEATAKAMIYETRLTADGMSQRQAEEFAKNGKKEAIAKFQKIMEKAQPDVERRKAIDAEVDKAEERLVELGMDKDVAHTSTMPWRAFLSIRAGQLGKTPQEMMEKLKLRLQKDNQEAQQAFAQKLGDVRGNPEVDAQALTDFIQSAENPEVRQQAINELLDLMSTERQKDVVKDNKAPTQKVYQKDIDARVREAAEKAGVDLADMESPVTRALIRQTIINDALYVVKSNPTAVGWYDLKVRQCLAYAEEVFPELNPKGEKFNPNELFKFLYILAVTSNGQKVSAQFAQTVGLYKEYKKTGKIPVKAFGPQGTAIAHALKNFPNLTEKFGGMDNMRKFFMTAWTVRQMTMMGFDVTGEAADEIVRGAMILGPKIGNGFLCNMYGIFSALTMDRWFMRTFGRWTGTLIEFKPEALNSRLVELKSALKELKSNKELANYVKDELGFDISKALQLLSNKEKRNEIVHNEEALDGERGELVKMVQKAANIIMASEYHKKFIKQWKDPGQKFYDSVMRVSRALLTDKQSPRGATERKYIRGLFNDALEVLHNQPGLERLTMADLQALLWYAEKKIYENTKTEGDEYVEDYDTDEAPDYANAMYEIALKEGVSKEKLDSIKQRVEKEIEDEQRRTQEGSDGSEGSSGIGHDSLSEKEKVFTFRTLVFGAMRSLRKLSNKSDKKQGQRGKTVYGKKWEVGSSELLSSERDGGSTVPNDDSRRNSERRRGNEPTPIAEWVVGTALRGRLKETKTSFGKSAENAAPKFQEFAPTEQSATTFLEALRVAKQSQGIAGLCVEEKSIEELTGKDADHSQCRIFLSEDKKSGFVIKNGDDLVSVFSTRGHGAGDAIVECAIAAGARRLDCFSTVLPRFYASHGFRPVARLTFDPNYAPEGWDYNYFGKYNEGKPDIIFMVLDNDFNGFITEDLAELPETQDYGTTECNAALEKYSKNNAVIQESVDEATANFQKPKDTDTFAQSLADALYQLAYHGSPYRFDRFSLEHIGEGEGVQVHGWGLYFALNRAVAEAYEKNLAHSGNFKYYPDKELFERTTEELKIEEKKAFDKLAQLYSDIKDPEERASAMVGARQELNVINDKQTVLRELSKASDITTVIECLDGFKWLSNEAKNWVRTEIISKLKKEKQSTIYTVDIPDDDVMLREDASFDEQPKKVQKALKELWASINSSEDQKKRLKEWVDNLATIAEGNLPPDTADALVALAEKEGPDFFYRSQADKVLKALMPAIKIDAEEIYKNNKEYYDQNGEYEGTTGLELATNDLVEDLMYSGWLTWPSREWMNKFKPMLEDYKGARGWEIYRRLSTYLGSDMQASLMLNKFGIQGIRYNGRRDGECAVVFDDTTIKIVDMLNQLFYHGTPEQKKILKFSLDHIGTGEGGQAHGYGLYLAKEFMIASGYREMLAGANYTINGQDINDFRADLERQVNQAKGKEKQKLLERLEAFDEFYSYKIARNVDRAAINGDITKQAYEWFNKEVRPQVEGQGSVYAVDIPEDNELMREDAYFSEQPEQVQEAIRKLYFDLVKEAEAKKPKLRERWLKRWKKDLETSAKAKEYPKTAKALLAIMEKEGPLGLIDHDAIFKKLEKEIKQDSKGSPYGRSGVDTWLGATLYWASHDLADGALIDIGNRQITGGLIYQKLAERLGSTKAASEKLNEYGIPGMRYNGQRDGECAVVWDMESLKIVQRLQQLSEQAGPEKIRGSYLPRNTAQQYRQSVITLMECYDKSTFLHESAHAWLDLDTMIASDLADKIDRGEELTEGEQAFMKNLGGFFKWGQQEGVIDLGVTDDIKTVAAAARKWAKMDSAQQRGMHELFAEGFEAYLMEGLAPNKEMQSLFDQFKKWLIDVYSKLVRQPRPISKEVRKLYDLMFATEQQAEETQVRLGLHAMFDMDMAKQLGMTDEEIRKYQELEREATAETAGLVAKKVHGAMRPFGKVRKEVARRLEKERKEEIKKREEELRKEPRYKALSMLNSNKVKISEESLKSMGWSQESIDLFKERNWIAKEGEGVNLHVLASTVGTDSVTDLLYDLVDLERMSDAHDEVIKELAWEESVEHEGEGDFRELQANLCAYNETRSRLLTAEFNAIMRKLGGQQLMVRAAREYALNYISGIKVSDLHEKSYMAAERRCAKEAETAFRKGDFNAVVEAKRAQILNHELARAALEAKDRYERGKGASRAALKSKSVHPFYKRILDSLLENHSVSAMTAEERQKFAVGEALSDDEIDKIEETLQANGTPIEGIAKLLRSRQHVQEMTVNEANEFFMYVKQVAEVGRKVLKLSKIKEGERVDETNAKLEAQLEESATAQGRKRNTNIHDPRTAKQRAKQTLMEFLLGNVKVSAICKIFDGNKHGGIFWEVFIKPANECATFEAEQRKRASEWLRDKLLPAFKKNADEDPILFEGFDEPFTHGTRLAIALNLGNASNRERLVSNDPRFTDDVLQQIMDTLTEADWRAVEAVWQLFESFRPMIAAKQLRVYGVEPEWIEYEPFQVKTKEGKVITVSGGYYPVVYDYKANDRSSQLQDAKDAERMLQNAYQSPTTERSFTKKRVPGKVEGRPLRLDLSALYEGVNDVIHDLAWHEYLIDTGHILHGSTMSESGGIKQSIKEYYGSEIAEEIEQWRNDIALGDRGVGTPAWFNALTRNVGLAAMGYSLTTAAAQVTGVGYVIPQTGVPAFLKAMAKYMVHPLSTRRNINKMSDAMRLRAQTQFKELAQIRNRLEKGKGTISWMQEHAYVLTEIVQGFADTVSWQSAYERFKRDGYDGDKLIKMCDQVVVSTQASGNIHDLSRHERTKSYAKIFGVFYSWMNAALNLSVAEYFGETNKFKKIANLFFMCVLMPYIEQSFKEALIARGDDDDDDDKEPVDKYVREPLADIVEFNLGQFMYLREASNTAGRVIKGEPIFGYSGPAGLRAFKVGNEAIAALGKLAQTYDDPNYDRIMKNIIDVAGASIGAPSSQVKRTIKGLKAIDQGKVEGIDAIKAPLFGYKGRVD